MYEFKELKPYKGYGVDKTWEVDEITGKRISPYKYVVSDGDDYVGEEYDTIAEAHRAIDSFI